MTSRLDRLFVLLEAGVGAATRQAAARQLGEVQRTHPEELHRLLTRLMVQLRSPVWETRLAAAQAVEAILANVPEWRPPPYESYKEEKLEDGESNGRLRCEQFDIEGVLRRGSHLMASEGHEFDMDDEPRCNGDMKERMTKQRQLVNARLGLDFASKLGVDIGDLYNTEDLCLSKPVPKTECVRRSVQELVPVATDKPLSSREMNVAKRRARQAALSKQKSRENDDGLEEQPDAKRVKLEPAEDCLSSCTGAVPDASGVWSESAMWPLQAWSSALQALLFDGSWEARHGAASALRELLRAKISVGAGRRHDKDEDGHQEWLEDLALRFVCVLALDRFGDFVSDQVVAPVRETCAQALGVAAARLRSERAALLAAELARLASQPHWEARHGALLGLQYLLQGRQEVAISSGALEQLMSGLEDAAEDVSGVAAAALVPAAGALARARPMMLRDVVGRLWGLLHDQDDLAAPANSYMALLAALMALPEAAGLLHPIDLEDVLPRMWPYLQHSSSSVRKAALQTLRTITRPLCSEATDKDCPQQLSWTWQLLQTSMRHIYQRILFEHVQDIQDVAMEVWENLLQHASLSAVLLAACPLLATWLCLAMQSARLPADMSMLLYHQHRTSNKERRLRSNMQMDTVPADVRPSQKWYIGGSESQTQAVREKNVTRARCRAAEALGHLSCYLVQPAPDVVYKEEDESPIDCYVKVLVAYLGSGSGLQRLIAGLVISSWAHKCLRTAPLAPPLLVQTLHTVLNQNLYYDEVAMNCNKVLQEARDLVAMMKHYKLPLEGEEFINILRLEQVSHITATTQPLVAALKNKRVATNLEDRRRALHAAVSQCAQEQNALHISVQASLAGACAHLHAVPEKLNPVVRPLMDSIKRESAEELQQCSADALATLLGTLLGPVVGRRAQDKVLANLKAFLRCDPEYTPKVSLSITAEESTNAESGSNDSSTESCDLSTEIPTLDKYNGILTLWEQQRAAERAAPRRGRPPAHQDVQAETAPPPQEDEARKLLRIQRRGATLALTSLTTHFGEDLPEKLPKLWEFITEPLATVMTDEELDNQDPEAAEELISRLQVLETVTGSVHQKLWPTLLERTTALLSLTRHRLTAVRHMAARILASWADRSPGDLMLAAVTHLLPALEDITCPRARCGAAEGLARLVPALRLRVVPHAPLLAVPLLGRMSDHNPAVRMMSTRCFASLIQLMPLEGAVPLPAGLPQELLDRRQKDKQFLDQLFNPTSIKNYKIPLPISAELRSYQQAGVNWLRFLNEYKLHGVLCDDMGLGKTLQSIVVVAGDHHDRATKYRADRNRNHAPLPSLVVCPPTLTGHWVFEVTKFIPSEYLKPLQYVGPPVERERLRAQVKNYNLIVASYDIVRKDIDFFSKIHWNYCILDEGHVIKNGKTKAFKAIKRLIANHRLILSGTPIQNNVLELWSLFEFLLPGLLGTERQFAAQYARPILLAREPRASPHHLQAGARAVEALHRQVLPFLLRRVKEDVLKELPPKITQDYYCELSPLQRKLYEHCARAQPNAQRPHVFQALQYLQNVCNHPKLVIDKENPAHPAYMAFLRELALDRSSLNDIQHACKLPALKQLLIECGIGSSNPSPVSQHRALIFCQLKAMLDVVENDLLRAALPTVSYLRLDGSVAPASRHALVTRFNTDPSIDVLLLTTAVGGLGLNLTGADTVIFVEHDWNPMKDLQAMDRAHRIGQRKVVNVYRLITRGTLEEKIMGLQKFKLATANTVISSENAAIETMGTDQLLNLFQTNESSSSGAAPPAGSVLDALPDLWDARQYEDEYDMTKFINSLPKID